MKKLNCIIYAPIDIYSGYSSNSRDKIKSIIELYDEKWDIKIIPCKWGNLPSGFIEDNFEEWGFLNKYILPTQQQPQQPDIWIMITIPSEFKKWGKYNIGITAGIESDIIPHNWIEGCNNMDLIIVSSNHSKKAFLNTKFNKLNKTTNQIEGTISIEKPIEVIFEGVSTKTYQPIEWI